MLDAPVRVSPLLGGDVGTMQTVAAMRRDARLFAASPALRAFIGAVAGDGLPIQQYHRLRQWLVTNTRFRPDPDGIELLRTGTEQLRRIQQYGVMEGDCDDIATLAAGMVAALGRQARFVVLGFGAPGAATSYSHVFAEMNVGGAWRDFDLTRTPQSPTPTRRMEVVV